MPVKKRKPQQLELLQKREHRPNTKADLIARGLGYGGELRYRKVKRPFHAKRALHVIFRSRLLSGSRSLLRSNHKPVAEKLLLAKARRYHAKLYKFSVDSNHLHLLIQFRNREMQARFMRDLAGHLALLLKKKFHIQKEQSIWDDRPFSRLVKPGSFSSMIQYIVKNQNEASGLWAYKKRPISALAKTLEALATVQKIETSFSSA